MKTYYVGNMPVSDELYHYGRKGMKWGKDIFGDDDKKQSTTKSFGGATGGGGNTNSHPVRIYLNNKPHDMFKTGDGAGRTKSQNRFGGATGGGGRMSDIPKGVTITTGSQSSYANESRIVATNNGVERASKLERATDNIRKSVANAAKSTANFASKTAKDVGSWGSKQVDKGKKFFKKLFG